MPSRLEDIISAEKLFQSAGCPEILGYIEILAARMVDRLRINNESKILCVGPGLIYSHPLACEIKGAFVDIVQPPIYNSMPQNESLREYLDKAHEKIPESYRKGSINFVEGLIEEQELSERYYSHAFLLNVLDDDFLNQRQKGRMIDSILPALKDKSSILLSACSSMYDNLLDFFQDKIAKESGYNFRFEDDISSLVSYLGERAQQEINFLRKIAKEQDYESRIKRRFPGEQEVSEIRLKRLIN